MKSFLALSAVLFSVSAFSLDNCPVDFNNSDYIAKVKMIQKGKNKFELKVLENIIGNINASDVPNTDLLKPNRTYVILLRDVDGKKQPTNGKESYVLLEGNNKKIFDAVYEMFRSK